MATITDEEYEKYKADQSVLNSVASILSRDEWGADELEEIHELVATVRIIDFELPENEQQSDLAVEEFSNPT